MTVRSDVRKPRSPMSRCSAGREEGGRKGGGGRVCGKDEQEELG